MAHPLRANLICMNAFLLPIVSGSETEELASSYDLWFRNKVKEAQNSNKPRLPHDAAMVKVETLLMERRKGRANRSRD